MAKAKMAARAAKSKSKKPTSRETAALGRPVAEPPALVAWWKWQAASVANSVAYAAYKAADAAARKAEGITDPLTYPNLPAALIDPWTDANVAWREARQAVLDLDSADPIAMAAKLHVAWTLSCTGWFGGRNMEACAVADALRVLVYTLPERMAAEILGGLARASKRIGGDQ